MVPEKIDEGHKEHQAEAFHHYDRVATMGPKPKILEFREHLELKLQEMYEDYLKNNLNKRPDILRFITILLIARSLSPSDASEKDSGFDIRGCVLLR